MPKKHITGCTYQKAKSIIVDRDMSMDADAQKQKMQWWTLGQMRYHPLESVVHSQIEAKKFCKYNYVQEG